MRLATMAKRKKSHRHEEAVVSVAYPTEKERPRVLHDGCSVMGCHERRRTQDGLGLASALKWGTRVRDCLCAPVVDVPSLEYRAHDGWEGVVGEAH